MFGKRDLERRLIKYIKNLPESYNNDRETKFTLGRIELLLTRLIKEEKWDELNIIENILNEKHLIDNEFKLFFKLILEFSNYNLNPKEKIINDIVKKKDKLPFELRTIFDSFLKNTAFKKPPEIIELKELIKKVRMFTKEPMKNDIQDEDIDLDDVESLLKKAMSLSENLEFKKAVKFLDRVLQIDPNHSEAWINKGLALCVLVQLEQALDCFDQAIKLNNYSRAILLKKAIILTRLRRLKEANKAWEELISRNPKDVQVLKEIRYYDHLVEENSLNPSKKNLIKPWKNDSFALINAFSSLSFQLSLIRMIKQYNNCGECLRISYLLDKYPHHDESSCESLIKWGTCNNPEIIPGPLKVQEFTNPLFLGGLCPICHRKLKILYKHDAEAWAVKIFCQNCYYIGLENLFDKNTSCPKCNGKLSISILNKSGGRMKEIIYFYTCKDCGYKITCFHVSEFFQEETQDLNSRSEQILTEGNIFLKRQDYEGAIEYANYILEKDPRSSEALYINARANQILGKRFACFIPPEMMKRLMEQSLHNLTLEPGKRKTINEMLHREKEDPVAALEKQFIAMKNCQEAIKINPNNVDYWITLVSATFEAFNNQFLITKKSTPEIKPVYNEILEIEKKYEYLYKNDMLPNEEICKEYESVYNKLKRFVKN